MTKFKAAFAPAWRTSVVVFLGTVVPALFGWVNSLVNNFTSGNHVVPPTGDLERVVLSAIAALFIGLLNFVWRFIQAQDWFKWGSKPLYINATATEADMASAAAVATPQGEV